MGEQYVICTSCYRYDYPILVANREAGSAHERLILEDGRIARSRNKTYIRRTIKREEVETDRYQRSRKKKGTVPDSLSSEIRGY